MEAKALGTLLDGRNHSLGLSCRTSKLVYLIFWTMYLALLRTLDIIPHYSRLSPEWFQVHITRVESRIVNIAISIIQVVSGRDVSYSSFFRNNYRLGRPREESYEGSIISTGLADNLMAPDDSSLEMGNHPIPPPPMFTHHQPAMAFTRPRAPQPPYLRHNYENSRRSTSLISPLPSAIHAHGRRRNINNYDAFQMQSRSLDGTVSPTAFAEPIPRMPIPPLPAFIARMPFVSISDSIYASSDSTQILAVPSKAQSYIDLLPRRSFGESDGSQQASVSDADKAVDASDTSAHACSDGK